MTKPEQIAVLAVAALVENLAVTHRLVAERTLAPEGGGAAAAGLMWIVSRADPALSMREIAAMLACDPSYVTVLSFQLEEAGLLVRRPDSPVSIQGLSADSVECVTRHAVRGA